MDSLCLLCMHGRVGEAKNKDENDEEGRAGRERGEG